MKAVLLALVSILSLVSAEICDHNKCPAAHRDGNPEGAGKDYCVALTGTGEEPSCTSGYKVQRGESGGWGWGSWQAYDCCDEEAAAGAAIGIIIGIIIGSCCCCAAVGGGVWYCMKQKQQNPQPVVVVQQQPPAQAAPPQPVEAAEIQLTSAKWGAKFDVETGQPIPKFDSITGKQNWSD